MLRNPARLGAIVALALLSVVLLPAVSASAAQTTSLLQEHINKQLRTTQGGVQISANTVSYKGGSVLVVFPETGSSSIATQPTNSASSQALSTSDLHGCPTSLFTHWYCFYADINWGGRMLKFKDCGSTQDFDNFGFPDQVSSWVNTSGHSLVVSDVYDNFLWRETSNSSSSWVGSNANDRARSFYTNCHLSE
jgi:hypothetical protein